MCPQRTTRLAESVDRLEDLHFSCATRRDEPTGEGSGLREQATSAMKMTLPGAGNTTNEHWTMLTNERLHEGSNRCIALEDTSENLFLFGDNAVSLASDGVVMPIAAGWRSSCDCVATRGGKYTLKLVGSEPDNRSDDGTAQHMTSETPLDANQTRSTKESTSRKQCSHFGCQKVSQYHGKCSQHSERICLRQGCGALAGSNRLCPAHREKIRCSQAGCLRLPNKMGLCSAHGGFKQCSYPDCPKHALTKGLCRAHGGGNSCSHPGCSKSAKSKGLCCAHGGARRCSHPGCSRNVKSKGLCFEHGGGTCCSHAGCLKPAKTRGLCCAHGGGARCSYSGCIKHAVLKNYCKKHGGGVS
ncbi:hypothetical protein PHMEG_00012990 [Phytophthora megakarya]|uniref:WRKY19-like zinc finger domain-containing protein n=1 Tax=Phytophthora megakarya TaxID=4795 RepID=A0A225W8X6_9STRA|nr:hypothetical protein PHMEG_00012990 [Phytophthora megakarya]